MTEAPPTYHHRAGCEDQEFYYCSECHESVHQSKLNQCPVCVRFIPRMHSCICDKLPPVAPDWDWIRKERLENPEGG